MKKDKYTYEVDVKVSGYEGCPTLHFGDSVTIIKGRTNFIFDSHRVIGKTMEAFKKAVKEELDEYAGGMKKDKEFCDAFYGAYFEYLFQMLNMGR